MSIHGPECASDGRAFTVVSTTLAMGNWIGYVFPPKDEGPAVATPLVLPKEQKNHNNLNAFFVSGGSPWIIYDDWDKATGEVHLFAQRYTTSSFTPDEGPIPLGVIPLDARSYDGAHLHIEVIPSPDRTKMLFLFDDIQSGGIKLAMCWVTDTDLNVLWKGAYRIPVQAMGSYSSAFLLDNGHAYMRVHAVVLNGDNVKEKKDGSVAVKTETHVSKYSRDTWYELHGETFQKWDAKVPGMPGNFIGQPVMAEGSVVMNGVLSSDEEGRKRDKHLIWVQARMSEAFVPEPIASGRSILEAEEVEVCAAQRTPSGATYVHAFTAGHLYLFKIGTDHTLEWEHEAPWGSNEAYVQGEHLLMPILGLQGDLKDAQAGKKWSDHPYTGTGYIPMIMIWDPSGAHTVQGLLPDGVGRSGLRAYSGHFDTIDACGCFVDHSQEKEHPGLVRVCIQ
ncbi:MAG: hypothetical protein JST66_17055 [Bacteroidetes bacterium]|nr:hypothetical protein [Bacteroidota bacterium]